MTVKSVDSRGRLKLAKGGTRLSYDAGRLKALDKKNLALAIARKPRPGDCAVVAFYCLAAGDEQAGATWLARAGEKADAVRAAFE